MNEKCILISLIIGLVNEEKYLSNKVDNQVRINGELSPFSISRVLTMTVTLEKQSLEEITDERELNTK